MNTKYKGNVTWNVDDTFTGGMYVFFAELPLDYVFQTPLKIDEGILDWKSIDWILSDGNLGVGEMIPRFLPTVLNNDECYEHKFILNNNRLADYTVVPLTQCNP